ncbi:MAG: TRAP transporter small permease [Sneathiellaceae bacterium]
MFRHPLWEGLAGIWRGLLAVMIVFLAVLTLFDVLGRYVFSAPIPGALEITEIVMALMIGAALPLVERRQAHITVDFVEGIRAPLFQRLRRIVLGLVMAGALAVAARQMFVQAGDYASGNEHTMYFEVPAAPIAYAIAVSFAVGAVIALAAMLRPAPRPHAGDIL